MKFDWALALIFWSRVFLRSLEMWVSSFVEVEVEVDRLKFGVCLEMMHLRAETRVVSELLGYDGVFALPIFYWFLLLLDCTENSE